MLVTDKREKYRNTSDFRRYPQIILHLKYRKDLVVGEFLFLPTEQRQEYYGISQFIYKIQLLMEEHKNFQEAAICRKYDDEPLEGQEKIVETFCNQGEYKKDDFLIHIRYCCSYSWQGHIQWKRYNRSIPFRSVLELVMLLESSMSCV